MNLKQWWKPSKYHVEYFKGNLGMASYHDKHEFNTLDAVKERMTELEHMNTDAIIVELGFIPTFLRIMQVTSGNPITRFLNYCGRKRLWRFNLCGWRIRI